MRVWGVENKTAIVAGHLSESVLTRLFVIQSHVLRSAM